MDWLTLLAWRFLLGALVMWVWLLFSGRRRAELGRLSRSSVLTSLGLGTAYTVNSATYFAGLETVPASLAALLLFTYPAIVATLSLRFGKRLSGRRQWLALFIVLTGAGLAIGDIDTRGAPTAFGLVLIAATPVIYSGWIILTARLGGERPGRYGYEVQDKNDPRGAAPVSALMLSASAAVFVCLALIAGRTMDPRAVPSRAWVGVLGLGLLSTFLAIQTFYGGARRIGAANAALLGTTEPLWSVSLAALLLHEHLRVLQIVGGGLIVFGVLLIQTSRLAGSLRVLRR